MSRTKTTKRIPFSFTHSVRKVHNGITYAFNSLKVEGWVKVKQNKVVADIDDVYLNQTEIKGDLESLNALNEIEEAAEAYAKQLLKPAA